MARKFNASGNTNGNSTFVYRPENRPPAIQKRIGNMKPGHHSKVAYQIQNAAAGAH